MILFTHCLLRWNKSEGALSILFTNHQNVHLSLFYWTGLSTWLTPIGPVLYLRLTWYNSKHFQRFCTWVCKCVMKTIHNYTKCQLSLDVCWNVSDLHCLLNIVKCFMNSSSVNKAGKTPILSCIFMLRHDGYLYCCTALI